MMFNIRSKTVINIISLVFCLVFLSNTSGEKSLDKLREIMVKRQIQARGVKDERVIEAMLTVERHKFVSTGNIREAYDDHPLPIGYGQTISQPYIVALMTELCELDGSEKVLEIGTGSGYQAAVLSLLSKEVFSIEIVEPLGKMAAKRLKDLGYDNVNVKIGDGYRGWPGESPFDVIILTASPPELPETLFHQLKEGGILVAPVGDFSQELVKVQKVDGKMVKETVTYVRFVPMVHGSKKK